MQVLLIANGAVRHVQKTKSLSVQKNNDGTYNYDGGHFGAERAMPEHVMI